MAWRTLFISHPARLSCTHDQLLLEGDRSVRIPLEDIMAIVIESPQVTLTSALLSRAADHRVVIVTCGEAFLPNGVFSGFHRHSRQTKVEREQVAWSEPFKKRLQQKIVRNKILNQAYLLKSVNRDKSDKLINLSTKIQSGDVGNREAQAAAWYFRHLFKPSSEEKVGFTRDRTCIQNSALNYGYAIIRGATARSITSYGLIPSRGIFHGSELNAFNLADDIMEPFRPFVDAYVVEHWPVLKNNQEELNSKNKQDLIELLYKNVRVSEERMYLVNALELVVKSLLRATEEKDPRLYKQVEFDDTVNKEYEC